MTQTVSNKQRRKASKRDNDAFSREMAEVRAVQRRRARVRNRVILVTVLVVVVALAAGGTWYGFWRHGEDLLTGPRNMASDGILLTGDGTKVTATTSDAIPPHGSPVASTTAERTVNGKAVPVVLYLDYGTAKDAQLVTAQTSQLTSWLTGGVVSVELHPVATSTAHHGYSARAANAVACVAASSPSKVLTVSDALMAAAAKKGFAYPDAAGIAKLVKKAGVTSPTIAGCITGDRYAAWVAAATSRATHGTLPASKVTRLASTPLVLVDGQRYTGSATDTTAFETFTEGVYDSTVAAATGTDTSGG